MYDELFLFCSRLYICKIKKRVKEWCSPCHWMCLISSLYKGSSQGIGVLYLKTEAMTFSELVCTQQPLCQPQMFKMKTLTRAFPFERLRNSPLLKVLRQFLLHSTQLVSLYIKRLVFYFIFCQKSLAKRKASSTASSDKHISTPVTRLFVSLSVWLPRWFIKKGN